MSIPKRKRKCQFCKEWFHPDPRVGSQQKACGNPSCQKARKKQSQKRWVKKNPEYFKGRYENTHQWLKKHPGYLKSYRKSHPDYVKKNRDQQRQHRSNIHKNQPVDIQDAIITQTLVTAEDSYNLNGVDIQDTIKRQLVIPVHVNGCLSPVDIQDNMFKRVFSRYTFVRIITRKQLQQFYAGHCYG